MDAPWSTSSAEQVHASATIFRKYHPEYGTETLMVRAFLHPLRLLMPGPTQEEKQLSAQARRVTALLSKKPQHIAGRQVFVQDLMSVAASWKQEGRVLPPSVQKSIMKRHGKKWKSMAAADKSKYEKRATLQRATSDQQLGERIAQESETLSLMSARLGEQQDNLPLLLSQCKLSSQEVGDLTASFQSPTLTNPQVKTLRAQARATPHPPDDGFKRLLGSFGTVVEELETPRPVWLRPCCWNRASFSNVALRLSGVAGNRFLRFLFATQSPMYACFCEMEEA